MELAKDIGGRLKSQRKMKGYTLREVGELIGIDYSYVGKIENGKVANPSVNTLESLCQLYGIKFSSLFGTEVEMPKELKELDVEWITLDKELIDEGLTPQQVRDAVRLAKMIKGMS